MLKPTFRLVPVSDIEIPTGLLAQDIAPQTASIDDPRQMLRLAGALVKMAANLCYGEIDEELENEFELVQDEVAALRLELIDMRTAADE